MIYILLLIGIFLILYGWTRRGVETSKNRDPFKEIIHRQETDKREYIEILSLNHEIKSLLVQMDEKLDRIQAKIPSEQEEEKELQDPNTEIEDYNRAAGTIKKMLQENKSIDEIAKSLNMAKGEVLLLKRLLNK